MSRPASPTYFSMSRLPVLPGFLAIPWFAWFWVTWAQQSEAFSGCPQMKEDDAAQILEGSRKSKLNPPTEVFVGVELPRAVWSVDEVLKF